MDDVEEGGRGMDGSEQDSSQQDSSEHGGGGQSHELAGGEVGRATPLDVAAVVAEQLSFHWEYQITPRLSGLTDEEYLWEPVPGWTLRRRGDAPPAGAQAVGSGPVTIDFAPIGMFPDADGPVAPVTTIAWRMAHVACGVFAEKNAAVFGGPALDYDSWPYTLSAQEAVVQLEEGYQRWIAGVRALTLDQLAQPWAPGQGPYGDDPVLALVMHVHREVIHHLAEVALLRDLYAHRPEL